MLLLTDMFTVCSFEAVSVKFNAVGILLVKNVEIDGSLNNVITSNSSVLAM